MEKEKQKKEEVNISPCPNPDVCGSCGWSHIPYEKQLKQKISDINGSFALKKTFYSGFGNYWLRENGALP